MWWYIVKILDTKNKVVYSYGCETREQSGKVEYNRVTNKCRIIKLAKNDTDRGSQYLFPHIFGVVNSEGAPTERQISIG